MSYWNEDIDDWFKRFLGKRKPREGFESSFFSIFAREMERMLEEEFGRIPDDAPRDIVREYETPEGEKVREIGPLIYGYSVTIGPDGKPKIRRFGNVKGPAGTSRPKISSEREPFADVITSDKDVTVVVEIPGVDKSDIKVNALDDSIEIKADTPQRKYHRILEIPAGADVDSARSTYKNGILEIKFDKKQKNHGKEISIE